MAYLFRRFEISRPISNQEKGNTPANKSAHCEPVRLIAHSLARTVILRIYAVRSSVCSMCNSCCSKKIYGN